MSARCSLPTYLPYGCTSRVCIEWKSSRIQCAVSFRRRRRRAFTVNKNSFGIFFDIRNEQNALYCMLLLLLSLASYRARGLSMFSLLVLIFNKFVFRVASGNFCVNVKYNSRIEYGKDGIPPPASLLNIGLVCQIYVMCTKLRNVRRTPFHCVSPKLCFVKSTTYIRT